MELQFDTLKCDGCRACEFACNYHHDRNISPIGSSLMYYREEKKNYYGMVLKREKSLFLAKPDGPETILPGQQVKGGGASAKPILLRVACDLCKGAETPLCVKACPRNVIRVS
jgi:Fe-S-cluster-containing dehydrogenase component